MNRPLRHSAVYRGRVRHRRLAPKAHAFDYELFMLYLDLDELPQVFDGSRLWSVGRGNVCSFRREDYLGDAAVPLKQAVLDRVQEATGVRPDGPVRMLTQVRMFGFVFNPVSFYYCFDRDERLTAFVAEITNTPWNQRHSYVLTREGEDADADAAAGKHRWTFAKDFHVSPFMGMDQDYVWHVHEPGERLFVHMDNLEASGPHGADGSGGGRRLFDATLSMEREALSPRALRRCLTSHPFMTFKVVLGIYWQALRLFLKRTPFHTHPSKIAGGVS